MPNLSVAPSQANIFKTLGDFLTQVLPATCRVQQSQINRVPEPNITDFCVMNGIRMSRLSTNIDTDQDALFEASIAGLVMTVTDVLLGTVPTNTALFGVGVAAGTRILDQITGSPGGPGTYAVSVSQTLAARQLSAGSLNLMQPTMVSIQIDLHGPASADNAQIIATTLRDGYGVDYFAASGFDLAPLYNEDPRQVPFLNEGQQIEQRWIVEVRLQANQGVRVPQEYAGAAEIDVVSVEAAYPPS